MQQSKIQLSEEEMQLVRNKGWILTKQKITAGVYDIFGGVSEKMQQWVQNNKTIPAAINHLSAKISKGEQYESLPYVVLDYPRYFSREDVFAIRTFFWWGNYFTSTLHIKGRYKDELIKKIRSAITMGKFDNCYLSLTGNEFDFNVEGSSYQLIQKENHQAMAAAMVRASFIKISTRISFDEWNRSGEMLWESFQSYMTVSWA